MSSLSRIVKNSTPKADTPRPNNVAVASVAGGVAESKYDKIVQIDVDGDGELDTVEYEQGILFICDCDMTQKVKEQLSEHERVKPFSSELFTNRTLDELYENHSVKMVWVNVKSKPARYWLGQQLPKKSRYFKVISVYSTSKKGKWLSDIEDFTQYCCKLSELKKQIKALDYESMMSHLSHVDIHSAPNKLLACFGFSKLTKKKSKK